MSQSALAMLLGKKPATPAVAGPVSPASTVATTVAVAPTPAPVAVQSASTPAPTAATSATTAGPSPALGPNAVAVLSGQTAPPDTLAALLGDFQAASGKAPRVNPPQAAAVLAGPTAAEVAGHPEPEEVVEAKVAPVAKPQSVLDAENAPKTRRTAAIVQVELDAALARIAQLEAEKASTCAVAGQAVSIAQEGAEELQAEAVALIEQLRAEAAVSLEDNRKAWARVADLEAQLEKVTAGALRAEAFAGSVAAPADADLTDEFQVSTKAIVAELFERGYSVVKL